MADTVQRETWVLYDGQCAFCTRLADRLRTLLSRRGYGLAPLQTSWVRERLEIRLDEDLTEMKVLTREGEVLGGADAVIFLARSIWWAWPFYAIAHLPGMKRLIWSGYRWIAVRRSCLSGSCQPPGVLQWPGWLPLAIFPLAALLLWGQIPSWAFMWLLAGTIFFCCKWLTWWLASAGRGGTARWRTWGYLLLWPGMDAQSFLHSPLQPLASSKKAWGGAVLNTLLGMVLLWGGVGWIPTHYPILIGWLGMIGLIFVLHFGIFHLLALVWRRVGIPVDPVMNRPAMATSLGDFWGKRWNLAFHQLFHRFLFIPSQRKLGTQLAIFLVFLGSGLLHDLVISLPAGAGFGLPTAYFLVQGVGLVLERSRFGKKIGLDRGLMGRFFTVATTVAPVFLLFHPPFIGNVIIPFLHAIGALEVGA